MLILALRQVQRSHGRLYRMRRVSNLLAGDSAFRGRLPPPRKVMPRTIKFRTGLRNGGATLAYFGKIGTHITNGPRKLRSEEHTSELQSLMRISYAVFCLKKKKTNLTNIMIT